MRPPDDEDDFQPLFPPKNFLETLIGKTKEDASLLISTFKMRTRIRSVDGMGTIGTADFRQDRVNLHLVNNIVTKANIG